MSEHWLHYGSTQDSTHCAECGCEITPITVLRNGATILTAEITMPKPSVGYWKFSGNIQWHCTKRPRWLTRVMMKWLLDWEWEEVK